MTEREREKDEVASFLYENSGQNKLTPSTSSVSSETYVTQQNIDLLFEHDADAPTWEPAKPPDVLGEFLDSRHMLPLLLPSDPRLLSASPKKPHFWTEIPPQNERSVSRSSRRS